MEPEQRDELREKAAGDDVIMLLLQRYAPLWLAGSAGRRHHGGGDGERLANSRALDNVYGGRFRLLRRQDDASAKRCRFRPDASLSFSSRSLLTRLLCARRRRSLSWRSNMRSQVLRRCRRC